jgi:hypothetical protein
VRGIVFDGDPSSSKRANGAGTATCPVISVDKPPINGGKLVFVQALQVELIPKQSDPAAKKGTYCGFRILVRVIAHVLGCFGHLPQCIRTAR